MPATRITFKNAKENLRDYFFALEETSSFSLPIFIRKSKDSEYLKFLKALLRSEDLSTEKYYLTTKDSADTLIDDLKNSKMIIFENFELDDYKNVNEIKDFNKAPYIPIVAFVDSNVKNNIDQIYDSGVDLVIQKSMFFSQLKPPRPDYSNLTYFVISLNKLLLKSDVLKWFWQVSQEIVKNIDEVYESGIKVIDNGSIKKRVIEKLKIAFGHLRKPHTSYDFNYDFTNEEFAFLTYWSCLNEYIEEWISIKEIKKYRDGKKEIISGSVFLKGVPKIEIARYSQTNGSYYSNFKSDDIFLLVNDNLQKYFRNIFKDKAQIYSYIKICDDFKGDYFDKNNKYPKICIPIILLSNGVGNPDIRGEFAKVNLIRNNLDYTHGDKYLIKTSNIKKQRGDGYQVYENLVGMVNLLFLLLNTQWKFSDEQKIQEIIKCIKRLVNANKKEMDINLMRFVGKIKKVIPDNNYNEIVLFLAVSEALGTQREIGFIKGSIKTEYLRELNEDDKVEVYAKIISGYGKEGEFYQFIQLEDIIKIS